MSEKPERIWAGVIDNWNAMHGYGLRVWGDDPRVGTDQPAVEYVRATRLAAAEEEIERLAQVLVDADEILAESDQDPHRDPAIQDVVDQIGHRVGYGALMCAAAYGWRNSLDENLRGGEFAIGPCRSVLSNLRRTIRAALTDTATEGQACDAGDVRRRALEEAAQIADDEDGDLTTWGEDRNTVIAQRTAEQIAAAIRALIATPATPTVEAMPPTIHRLSRAESEAVAEIIPVAEDLSMRGDERATVALAWLRALSQQEGGENG